MLHYNQILHIFQYNRHLLAIWVSTSDISNISLHHVSKIKLKWKEKKWIFSIRIDVLSDLYIKMEQDTETLFAKMF